MTENNVTSDVITAIFILLPLLGFYYFNEPFEFVALVYLAIIAFHTRNV